MNVNAFVVIVKVIASPAETAVEIESSTCKGLVTDAAVYNFVIFII